MILIFVLAPNNLHYGWFDSSGGCRNPAKRRLLASNCSDPVHRSPQIIAKVAERSAAEMIAKLGIVEQELDESMLWLELLGDAGIVKSEPLCDILGEAEELLKMTVSSIKTLKAHR
jgi:23S rRNA-intervening sequence protein